MFPEEAPREEPERRALHHRHSERRALHHQREDLRALPFPLGDWGEPAERLEELYRWAESGALHTCDWYLADRVWKRHGARGLRRATAFFGTVGAGLPLIELTGVADGAARWGYVALLLAAAC